MNPTTQVDGASHLCDTPDEVACRVVYYRHPSGRVPVRDFIDALAVKQQAAVMADLSLLGDEGPVLPFPLTSAIATYKGLRELRTRHGGSQFRLIYMISHGDVVVLHGFQKTSSSQIQKEYALAAERARRIK